MQTSLLHTARKLRGDVGCNFFTPYCLTKPIILCIVSCTLLLACNPLWLLRRWFNINPTSAGG